MNITHTNPDRAIPTGPSAGSRSRHGSGCRLRWRCRPSKVCGYLESLVWIAFDKTDSRLNDIYLHAHTRERGVPHMSRRNHNGVHCDAPSLRAPPLPRQLCRQVREIVEAKRTHSHPISQHHPLSRPQQPPTHMAGGCRLQPAARTAGSKFRSPSPRRRRTSSRRLDEEGEKKGSRRKCLNVEEEGCVRSCKFVRL